MSLRILFLGENWYGSCARACCYALRRLGCDVLDIDEQTYLPASRSMAVRLGRRLVSRWLIHSYNSAILDATRHFRPQILFAFKGAFVRSETLRVIREQGVRLYNYYPDRMLFVRGTLLQDSLPEYDCVFDTKRHWDGDTECWMKLRSRVVVLHGYDPQVHCAPPPSDCDASRYASDVSFVGNHSPRKQRILQELARLLPELNLKIWGDGWSRVQELTKFLQGWAPKGDQYARIAAHSHINLAIMGVTENARDETTTRTFEIPACGGFMLHERTPELLESYKEGKEVACFGSAEELADQIQYYLAHPAEREAIARAGHAHCVPAYSYDNRVGEILCYYKSAAGIHTELGVGRN